MRRRRTLLIVGGLVLVVVAAVAWIGVRAFLAKGELEAAVPLAQTVREQVVADDPAAAGKTARELAAHARSAAGLTSDPIWRAAEVIPWVGPNLSAVRELAGATEDVAVGAITPLVNLAGSLRPELFKPVDGAVPLQPIVDAQEDVRKADDALEGAAKRVRTIDEGPLISQVRGAVDQLRPVLTETADTVDAARRAIDLMPAMLGADGPRTYLVMFQNPAEPRASGGNPGALALIGTDGGRISLLQQASTADFPRFPEPVLPLPTETAGIYGNITGRFMQNVTLTPRFQLSAELASEMWFQRFGTRVDGVLSIDPVALGYLLNATGPIPLATGDQLTGDNAAALLLNEVYLRYPAPADQDAFFAAASGTVFERIASGGFDPAQLIAALAQAGTERRVLLWNASPSEQAILDGTTLTDLLPTEVQAPGSFGVYINDATGSKMGYYLDVLAATGVAQCDANGQLAGLRLILRSNAPADAATALNSYITGVGQYGVPRGNFRFNVAVYAPPGSMPGGVQRDGVKLPAQLATDGDFPVTQFVVELAPGETTTIDLGVTKYGASHPPEVVSTPKVHLSETQQVAINCEFALQ
ncbi:DUF4012 domain-containing protein [Plantibacter flavus]|uniref:DUF4012 domain-containing protein n=1 Tax=Plantibacter flavus TaxID=150123 RepID=UPI0033991920